MLEKDITDFLISKGVSDIGFCETDDGDFGSCRYAVSIVVRLSEAIVTEIDDAPTHTYFNHYRSVNAFIDRTLLELGLFLQSKGYNYITVAASQSMKAPYSGRYSHKKAAVLSGLGWIGKNNLFFHKEYGSVVRLGTLFTDCPLSPVYSVMEPQCGECTLCAAACPAGAITGLSWCAEASDVIFLPEKCSRYMKSNFQSIGRGAVCGICMCICPKNNLKRY